MDLKESSETASDGRSKLVEGAAWGGDRLSTAATAGEKEQELRLKTKKKERGSRNCIVRWKKGGARVCINGRQWNKSVQFGIYITGYDDSFHVFAFVG